MLQMWILCFLLVLRACATDCAASWPSLRQQGDAKTTFWKELYTQNGFTVHKVIRRQQALRRLLENEDIATRSCDDACRQQQRNALSSLYINWGGSNWTNNQNWGTNSSVCQWFGVLCCLMKPLGNVGAEDLVLSNSCPPEASGVLGLSLPSNNMTGDIGVVDWAAFNSTLLLLDLDGNNLSGNTSAWATSGNGSLTKLNSVQYISAGGNRLQGPLEPFLALRNMSALLLHFNQLSGTIPEGLMTHPSLQYLDLDDNKLSGSLPRATFTTANRLRSISIASNRISGTFPESESMRPSETSDSLTHLDVSNNRIEGTLPAYLAWLLLNILDASSNRLNGSVAPLLQTSWTLLSLNLSTNWLNGSLPSDVRCRHVTYLDLSYNNLTGTIPTSFSKLHSVVDLLLNDNRDLTGQLPDELATIMQLSYFDVRNTSMQAAIPGLEGLPQLITFSNRTVTDSSNGDRPICPVPLLRGSIPVGIAPYYWQYGGCMCKAGFTANYLRGQPLLEAGAGTTANGSAGSGPVIEMICFAKEGVSNRGPLVHWWGIVVAVLGGLLVLALLLLLAYRLVPSLVRYRTLLAKRMPPGFSRRAGGRVVTMVLTDVEGSTELWEWDTDLMAAAIDLHDHTLRSQMSKWYGYEVQTEGDAFLMAFHEPMDAVGWCITTQLALLNADWNRELFRHHQACIETLESLQPSSQGHSISISQGGGGGITGTAPQVTETGIMAGRPSLPPGVILGPGPQTMAVVGGTSGLSSARGGLTPLRISVGGNDDVSALAPSSCVGGVGIGGAIGAGGGAAGMVAGVGMGVGGSQDNSRLASEVKDPDAKLSGMASAVEFADWTRYTRLGVLYRGLRVRMGVATGVTDAITSHAITQRMEYSGEVFRRVQAVADLPHGGQVLLDTNTSNAIHNNLNELGIRTIQILTREKRRSNNGARPTFGGVLGSDRPRGPRSGRNRQSLDLAFAPEAVETPELAILYGRGAAATAAAADGDEEACPGAAAAGAGSGNALSVANSTRTVSVGGSWMRGTGIAATPINSLLSALGGGFVRASFTIARGSSPVMRQVTGPEPSGRSSRMGSPFVGRISTNPENSQNHLNYSSHANHYTAHPNSCSSSCKLQFPGGGLPRFSTNAAAASAAVTSTAAAVSGDIGSGTLAPQGSSEPCNAGGTNSYGPSGGRTCLLGESSSGGGAGWRALAGLGGSNGGTSGGLPATGQGQRFRPPSATGMCGVLGGHLERLSQESSCEDRDTVMDPDADPQLVDAPNRDDREAGSGGVAGRQTVPTGCRNSCVDGGRGIVGAGGNGGAAGLGVSVGDAPVSTSDMESIQYGRSPRDVQVGHLREVPAGPVSQATPPTRATAALNTLAREVIQRRSSIAPAISVVNMGVYELNAGSSLEYVNITQVLVPGLEERARLGKPLDSAHQLTPGYFDAPATSVAPLGSGLWTGMRHGGTFPVVTLVFCSMERFTEMVSVNRDLSMNVMAAYNDCVRRSLLACNGYECQEQEGNYMIAFARPSDALEWCLMLQEFMMEIAWTSSMLRLPAMQEELHPLTGTVLFRGPRIKAGVYQGVPTRVSPHSTTGRADYFGPLVNRAARYCHAAAQGGQVIVARSLVEEILRDLLHGELLLADELPPEAFPVREVAIIDNSGVVPPRWCMPQDVMDNGLGVAGGGSTAVAPSPNCGLPIVGGNGNGSAQRTGALPKLMVPLVDASSGAEMEVGLSTTGSIMILPVHPTSVYSGGGGGRGDGGVSRLGRVRYQSPPPPRGSYGGDSGNGESDRGGAEGVIARSVPPDASLSALQHSLTLEPKGIAAALDASACSSASMTSGSAAAAAAAGVPAAAAAAAALDVRESNGSTAANNGFVTVEVPLSELASYNICPASVPRRMRPAVEHALAESRRCTASQRHEQQQNASRLGALYATALLPSRLPSRRTVRVPLQSETAPVDSGYAMPFAAPAGPIAYSTSLAAVGEAGSSGRLLGGVQSARAAVSGTSATTSTVVSPAGMPLRPQTLPGPQGSLFVAMQQAPTLYGQQQQQEPRFAMGGSESAYLELTPLSQQELQQHLMVVGLRGATTPGRHVARAADPLASAPTPAVASMEELPLPSPMPARHSVSQRALFDLHRNYNLQKQQQQPQFMVTLHTRMSANQGAASANGRPSPNRAPYLTTFHCQQTPGQIHQQPAPQLQLQQQQQQQQQQHLQPHHHHLQPLRAQVRATSSGVTPWGLVPSRGSQGRRGTAAMSLQGSLSGPEGQPQALPHDSWRNTVAATSGGGNQAAPLPLHSATFQSVESMLSHEHSAAFNALWEMATDEAGLPSGSRVDGLPSAGMTGLGGFDADPTIAPATARLGDCRADVRPAQEAPRLPAALRSGPSAHARHRGSFLVMDSTPGCLPTLPELCIRRRVGPYKWLWAHELVVEDLGQFRFKGVAGKHSIVSVSTAGTSERKLGSRVKKSKGECVEPGKGLLYRIVLQPMEVGHPPPEGALIQAAYNSESGPIAPRYAPPIASVPAAAYPSYSACPLEPVAQLSPMLQRDVISLSSAKARMPAAAVAAAAASLAPPRGSLAQSASLSLLYGTRGHPAAGANGGSNIIDGGSGSDAQPGVSIVNVSGATVTATEYSGKA